MKRFLSEFLVFFIFLRVILPSECVKWHNCIRYGVALTSIPPRFPYVHYTVESWINQSIIPAKIFIFIPKFYYRFKSRNENLNTGRNMSVALYNQLMFFGNSDIVEWLEQGMIHIIETPIDWGPATKYLGIFDNIHLVNADIDYWVVGDDDVAYHPTTLARYDLILENKAAKKVSSIYYAANDTMFHAQNRVYSLFSDSVRMILSMKEECRYVFHVQGVDTYMISQSMLVKHQNQSHSCLNTRNIFRLIHKLHSICPSSFYQDDYVLSFFLAMENIFVSSFFDGKNAARHIEGVSKSNFQMHLHPKVQLRESETRECLLAAVEWIFQD